MEPATSTTASEAPNPVYFCHVCMSRVSARKTSTQELECRRCEQTFVEELVESVVANESLDVGGSPAGERPGDAAADRSGGATVSADMMRGVPAGGGGFDAMLQAFGMQPMGDLDFANMMPNSGSGPAENPARNEEAESGEDARRSPFVFTNRSSGTRGSGGAASTGEGNNSGSSRARRSRHAMGSPFGAAGASRSHAQAQSVNSGSGDATAAAGGASTPQRRGSSAGRVGAGARAGEAAGAGESDREQVAANGLEQLLEQLLGGALMPSGLFAAGAADREGTEETGGGGRNRSREGANPGAGAREGGASARGARASPAATGGASGGGGGRRAAQAGRGGPDAAENPFLATLLQALGSGRPGQHTEIFIGPNMQRVHGGPGGAGMRGSGDGGSGLRDPSVDRMLMGGPGGLGLFLRGFGMGGAGAAMGPGGNVGDYAFGDLSQLIQQLMAADPNRHGPPPASKEVVEKLPTIMIAKGSTLDGQECAVCKDDFCSGDTARELPCTHSFHEQCILPWVSERNTCPTCRHELPTDEDGGSGGGGDGNRGDSNSNSEDNDDAVAAATAAATNIGESGRDRGVAARPDSRDEAGAGSGEEEESVYRS